MKSFKKLFDEFMNAPWRVEEFPLTREGKVKIEITYQFVILSFAKDL